MPSVGTVDVQVSSRKADCSRSLNRPKLASAAFNSVIWSPVESAQHFIYRLVRTLMPVPGFVTVSVVDISRLPRVPLVSVRTPSRSSSVTDGPITHGGGVGLSPVMGLHVLCVDAPVIVLGRQVVVRVPRLVVGLQGSVVSVVIPVHWVQGVAGGVPRFRGPVVVVAVVDPGSVVAVVAGGAWVGGGSVVWISVGGTTPVVRRISGHPPLLTKRFQNILHMTNTLDSSPKRWAPIAV